MSIVLHFFPNGEFSQGVDTSSRRRPKKERPRILSSVLSSSYNLADIAKAAKQNEAMPAHIYSNIGTRFSGSSGQIYTLMETNDESTVLLRQGDKSDSKLLVIPVNIYRLVHLGLLSPLVYQSVQSCENLTSRKKLLSMSKRMSRNIRNAVYLLEQQPGGKDVLSFLTLTLPSLSSEELESCCKNWDAMVKRFMDWLRTKLNAAGIQMQHVYCTEVQSKRLINRGEYAPHLHIVFRGRIGRKTPWVITPKKARKAWGRCISAFVHEPFQDSALENLQRVKYSAARYLAKYLSKGKLAVPSGHETSPISSLHTQWGGMARTLSRLIRQATQRFSDATGNGFNAVCILNHMDVLLKDGCVIYFKRGFIPLYSDDSTGLERGLHVGSGCLRSPTYEGGLIPVFDILSSLPEGDY